MKELPGLVKGAGDSGAGGSLGGGFTGSGRVGRYFFILPFDGNFSVLFLSVWFHPLPGGRMREGFIIPGMKEDTKRYTLFRTEIAYSTYTWFSGS